MLRHNFTEVNPDQFNAALDAHGLKDALIAIYEDFEPELTGERPFSPQRNFHASSYVDCALKQVWALRGVQPSDSTYKAEYERSAKIGDAIHHAIQGALVKAGIAEEKDIEVRADIPKELRLSAIADGIIKSRDKAKHIFEIKSIMPKYFSENYIRWYLEKLDHYYSQVQINARFLGIASIYVYVVSSQYPLTRKLYKAELDAGYVDKQLERVAMMRSHLTNGTDPIPEPGACRFCGYRSKCHLPEKDKK